jgi:Uma2 family endonuclease
MMATVIEEPQLAATGVRWLTVADLAVMPSELPSGPVKFELDEGRLVQVMAPPGSDHGRMQSRVTFALTKYGEHRGLGVTFAEVAVVLERNPDRVFGPDAAFVAKRSLPVRTSSEGYLETMPEIVVEVRSKNDSVAEFHRKVAKYLQAGVAIVWLIDPTAGTATVCREKMDPRELRSGDMLTGEEVIPGLEIPVAELFVS